MNKAKLKWWAYIFTRLYHKSVRWEVEVWGYPYSCRCLSAYNPFWSVTKQQLQKSDTFKGPRDPRRCVQPYEINDDWTMALFYNEFWDHFHKG